MPIFAPLRSLETASGVKVETLRFSIEIGRRNGLIRELILSDRRWVSASEPIPDVWVSPSIDPRGNEYRARYEEHAEVSVEWAEDGRVVVRSVGRFYRISGEALPIQWTLRYDIRNDGICHVALSLRSDKETALRWVVASGGVLVTPPHALLIFEHEATAAGFGLDTQVYDLGDRKKIETIEENIPWFEMGTSDGSVDVVFPHSGQPAVGWTDTSPYVDGDPLGAPKNGVRLENYANGIRWQRYRVRNAYQWITPSIALTDEFYLGLQPVREDQPTHSLLSTHWEGPHQFIHGYQVPSSQEIEEWASEGVRLVIGGVNWASGDYQNPVNLEDARQFIATCHQHGMKVLPYVTLHDLEYSAPISALKDETWRMEPIVEFNYRSHLMCSGADEWREYWKQNIVRALETLEVDGLYIDFWAGKLLCSNARHGCAGGRYNAVSAGEMLTFARDALVERMGQSLIIANTNILPLAMINHSIDVRLVGEGKNIEKTPEKVLRAFYDPLRFGTSQLVLVDSVETISRRTVAVSVATTSTLAVRKREPERTLQELQHWENYRQCLDGLVDGANPNLTTYSVRREVPFPELVFVNVYQTAQALVIAMANLRDEAYEMGSELIDRCVASFGGECWTTGQVHIYDESDDGELTSQQRSLPMTQGYGIPSGAWAVFVF